MGPILKSTRTPLILAIGEFCKNLTKSARRPALTGFPVAFGPIHPGSAWSPSGILIENLLPTARIWRIMRAVVNGGRRKMQAKSHLALVVPTGEKRAVPAGRQPNAAYRKREHLTETEIEKLIEAARGNRHGHRDSTMILSRLSSRLSGFRDLRPHLGRNRLPGSNNLRHSQETWPINHAPDWRRRAEGATEAATRAGPEVSLRLCQ